MNFPNFDSPNFDSPNFDSPKLNLSRKPGAQPLMVDMERFFEFSFWIAEELLDLEAQNSPEFQGESHLSKPGDNRLLKPEWSGN